MNNEQKLAFDVVKKIFKLKSSEEFIEFAEPLVDQIKDMKPKKKTKKFKGHDKAQIVRTTDLIAEIAELNNELAEDAISILKPLLSTHYNELKRPGLNSIAKIVKINPGVAKGLKDIYSFIKVEGDKSELILDMLLKIVQANPELAAEVIETLIENSVSSAKNHSILITYLDIILEIVNCNPILIENAIIGMNKLVLNENSQPSIIFDCFAKLAKSNPELLSQVIIALKGFCSNANPVIVKSALGIIVEIVESNSDLFSQTIIDLQDLLSNPNRMVAELILSSIVEIVKSNIDLGKEQSKLLLPLLKDLMHIEIKEGIMINQYSIARAIGEIISINSDLLTEDLLEPFKVSDLHNTFSTQLSGLAISSGKPLLATQALKILSSKLKTSNKDNLHFTSHIIRAIGNIVNFNADLAKEGFDILIPYLKGESDELRYHAIGAIEEIIKVAPSSTKKLLDTLKEIIFFNKNPFEDIKVSALLLIQEIFKTKPELITQDFLQQLKRIFTSPLGVANEIKIEAIKLIEQMLETKPNFATQKFIKDLPIFREFRYAIDLDDLEKPYMSLMSKLVIANNDLAKEVDLEYIIGIQESEAFQLIINIIKADISVAKQVVNFLEPLIKPSAQKKSYWDQDQAKIIVKEIIKKSPDSTLEILKILKIASISRKAYQKKFALELLGEIDTTDIDVATQVIKIIKTYIQSASQFDPSILKIISKTKNFINPNQALDFIKNLEKFCKKSIGQELLDTIEILISTMNISQIVDFELLTHPIIEIKNLVIKILPSKLEKVISLEEISFENLLLIIGQESDDDEPLKKELTKTTKETIKRLLDEVKEVKKEWVENFKELVDFSSYSADFIKSINDFGFTCSFQRDGTIIFEGEKYEKYKSNSQINQKFLEDLITASLEKDNILTGYKNHDPLFKVKHGTKAAIDFKDEELKRYGKELTKDNFIVSLFEISGKQFFLLETRDPFGYVVIKQIFNNGASKEILLHPREVVEKTNNGSKGLKGLFSISERSDNKSDELYKSHSIKTITIKKSDIKITFSDLTKKMTDIESKSLHGFDLVVMSPDESTLLIKGIENRVDKHDERIDDVGDRVDQLAEESAMLGEVVLSMVDAPDNH
jgi:hypothetical protein